MIINTENTKRERRIQRERERERDEERERERERESNLSLRAMTKPFSSERRVRALVTVSNSVLSPKVN